MFSELSPMTERIQRFFGKSPATPQQHDAIDDPTGYEEIVSSIAQQEAVPPMDSEANMAAPSSADDSFDANWRAIIWGEGGFPTKEEFNSESYWENLVNEIIGLQKEPPPRRGWVHPTVFNFENGSAVIKGSKGDIMMMTYYEFLQLASYATDPQMEEYRIRPDIQERGRISRCLIPSHAK